MEFGAAVHLHDLIEECQSLLELTRSRVEQTQVAIDRSAALLRTMPKVLSTSVTFTSRPSVYCHD